MKLKTIPNRLKTVNNRLSNGYQAGATVRVGGSTWGKLRSAHFENNPLCVMCLKVGRVSLTEEVDHIVPLWMGGKEFDPKNLQSLCTECHKIKTASEATSRSKQFI